MSVTIKLDEHACLLGLHLPADVFESVKHNCSCVAKPAGICYTCLRRADMSLCSYPTKGLVSTIAPDHHASILQLQLTRSQVFISCILSACMSATVSSYQDPCILHLHPTIRHVCNNCIWPFPMSLTVASNQQSYL